MLRSLWYAAVVSHKCVPYGLQPLSALPAVSTGGFGHLAGCHLCRHVLHAGGLSARIVE